MAKVCNFIMDTNDFFDYILYSNEDTEGWEEYVNDVTNRAATKEGMFTRFENFMTEHEYDHKIYEVIYEAMRAFTNECIMKDNADFDLC